MKEYVQRCFTACETEEDKDRTEKVLKEVLQDRLKDGSAYTIDWTREPLPEWVLLWFTRINVNYLFKSYKVSQNSSTEALLIKQMLIYNTFICIPLC